MSTKEIEVLVFGKTFSFNVPETIRTQDFMEIADFVENKFNRIKREVGDLDSFKLGLLAAINIAEEYFSLKKENEQLQGALNKIDHLLPPLENINKPAMRSKEEGQMPILFNL